MRRFTAFTTWAILGLSSLSVNAHVGWGEINSVRCDNPYVCNNAPIELSAGASIDVIYDVIIQHGSPIKIEFSESGDHNTDNSVLEEGLPEISGLNSARITLPNIECTHCSLRVSGSGYSGTAMVNLRMSNSHSSYSSSSEGMQNTDNIEISNVASVPEDNVMQLMWHKVEGRDTLILMAEEMIQAMPSTGTHYQEQDVIGNARVVYLGGDQTWRTQGLNANQEYFFKAYTVGSEPHYSEGIAFNATTQNIGNNPPWPSFNITQNNSETLAIDPNKGITTITLQISDADTDDWHQIDWTGTSPHLMDTDEADNIIRFNPVDLTPGDYVIMASVSDSGTPTLSKSIERVITIMANNTSSQSSMSASSSASNSGDSKKGGGGGSMDIFMVLAISCLSFASAQWRRKRQ